MIHLQTVKLWTKLQIVLNDITTQNFLQKNHKKDWFNSRFAASTNQTRPEKQLTVNNIEIVEIFTRQEN